MAFLPPTAHEATAPLPATVGSDARLPVVPILTAVPPLHSLSLLYPAVELITSLLTNLEMARAQSVSNRQLLDKVKKASEAEEQRLKSVQQEAERLNRLLPAEVLLLREQLTVRYALRPCHFQIGKQAGNQFNGRNQLGISGISFKPGLQGGLLLHQQTYILLCLTNGLTQIIFSLQCQSRFFLTFS